MIHGDSMYYEWISEWGNFIVNGDTTYWVTTAEDSITYLTPSYPHNQDQLQVIVHDDRGGSDSIIGSVGIYAEGTKCRCGDVNGDSHVNVSDVVYLINYLFVPRSPAPPEPTKRADANNDCAVNISDVVYLINSQFVPGSPQPECCWIH